MPDRNESSSFMAGLLPSDRFFPMQSERPAAEENSYYTADDDFSCSTFIVNINPIFTEALTGIYPFHFFIITIFSHINCSL
jgi:hypothetical protein